MNLGPVKKFKELTGQACDKMVGATAPLFQRVRTLNGSFIRGARIVIAFGLQVISGCVLGLINCVKPA